MGPQGRSGLVLKISPPPGFDPRTVQPVASRYTDYTILPFILVYIHFLVFPSGLLEDVFLTEILYAFLMSFYQGTFGDHNFITPSIPVAARSKV